jgi:hypothetical protein
MINRILLACACAFVLSAPALDAQERLRYRDFQLGADVASVSKLTGTVPADVKMIHQRPAMLQDLEWRPRYFSRGASAPPDPVDRMVFSFYNDQLFRVLVDYDPRRTEGMTQADIEAAISTTYGVALKPAVRRDQPAAQYGDADLLLATWGNAESTVALFRASYPATYRIVVTSTELANLAQAAGDEAVRLDAREAPQRELEQREKAAADEHAAQEEAKRVNLPGFRP